MKIAIDISPLSDTKVLSHRVRGVGFYLQNLKKSLLKYYPDNEYTFFNRGEAIDSNIDLVHYPYFEPFFLTLPFFDNHKRVITVHDLTPLAFPDEFPVGVKGNIKWQVQKINLLRSDYIITDSNASKKDIQKYAGVSDSKIGVTYLAAGEEFRKIENLKLKKEIVEKYKLPEKFILYVGDVTWNKNLPNVIKAIKKADVPFVMVGAALMEENFDKTNLWNQDLLESQKLISENNKIIRLGFVPTEDLVALYNLASVFIMPSFYEGFGLPILEAMQSGCPVITSKNGSLPEVAGDAAYYVDAEDVNSIAKGISEVFESPKMQAELSRKGLEQANKFSWKVTAAETIQIYKKALG